MADNDEQTHDQERECPVYCGNMHDELRLRYVEIFQNLDSKFQRSSTLKRQSIASIHSNPTFPPRMWA